MPRLIVQPAGSELCGQTCVAMAAGVSLKKAISVIGHEGGTVTWEIIEALRELGIECADKLRRISRKRPNLPPRAMVVIHQPKVAGKCRERSHWMLHYDGQMLDPGGRWPEGYENWRITSYLEIS